MSDFGRNRKIFFVAVNTGYAENRLPDRRCRDFYIERSRHGLHCAIVGNVVIPGGFGSNDVCAEISEDGAWHQLAEGIASQGALPGIQLSSAWRGFQGIRKFVPEPGTDFFSEYRRVSASISSDQVVALFDALWRGTEQAVKVGFRHVQLHAAHGYLFNLLIDHRLSQHSELTLRCVHQWAQGLSSAGIESSLRFSLYSGHPLIDEHGQEQFLNAIAGLPVDYLDVSAGFYNIDKRHIYPSNGDLLSTRSHATMALAVRYPAVNFIISGKAASGWDASHPPNLHLGICRDLIANPNFLISRLEGCRNCMKCHYFSRGRRHLTCGQWISGEGAG